MLKSSGIYLLFTLLGFSYIYGQSYTLEGLKKSSYENENVIIHEDKTVVTINAINKMHIYKHKVYTIFNNQGIGYNKFYIYYTPTEKVKNILLNIYNANGIKIDEFNVRNFSEHGVSANSPEITDTKVLYFEYLPKKLPVTFDFSYEIDSKNTAFIPSFYAVEEEREYVLKRSYSIQNKSTIPLQHKIYQQEIIPIKIDSSADSYYFEVRNIHGIKKEPFSPSLSNYFTNAQFSLQEFTLEGKKGDLSSWKEFGKWLYNDLILPQSEVPKNIQAELQNVVANAKNDKEKIQLLYTYLQENMRYVSIQLGIGGWKPMSFQSVAHNKYGDCKALSNFMRAALKSVGIDANYTILTSDSEIVNFDKDFPKFKGNHVILNVPLEDETVWLECTSNNFAFNYLGEDNANRNVLSINQEGGEIIKTPTLKDIDNQENINFEGTLDRKGNLTFSSQLEYKGALYGNNLYHNYFNDKELKKYFQDKFGHLSSLVILENSYHNDKINAISTENIKGYCSKYAKKAGNLLIIPAVAIQGSELQLNEDNQRYFPIEIQQGFTDNYIFTYFLPSTQNNLELPENIEIENSKFGRYSLQFSYSENKITVKRNFFFKAGTFSNENYKEWAQFVNSVFKADKTKIIITSP